MTMPLQLIGGGAVTPVGLDRPQTCAGIRARMARFEQVLRTTPFGAEQAVARIPAHWQLRRTPVDWLVNLAARAVQEVLVRHALAAARTALVMLPPEPFRHVAFDDASLPADAIGTLAPRVEAKVGVAFARTLQSPDGGAAAVAAGLDIAHHLLDSRQADLVLLAAADCYVLEPEFTRLDRAGRLRTARTAQGLTPGEGAACLLLAAGGPGVPAAAAASGSREPAAVLLGWGHAHEARSATSDGYSRGSASLDAMRQAAGRAGATEPEFGWTVSNDNGERYAAWESTLARARYFRTRRGRLQTVLPAMSVGETGAASGPLALLACAHRFAHGGRGTRRAMVELASEAGGRTACVVAPLDGGAP